MVRADGAIATVIHPFAELLRDAEILSARKKGALDTAEDGRGGKLRKTCGEGAKSERMIHRSKKRTLH